MTIICMIEREFDAIERRYNKLIEQKTLFASRAAARIRYILMEGALEEDPTAVLVKLLNQSRRSTEILEKLSGRMRLTEPFRMVTGQSLAHRRNMEKTAFAPQAVVRDAERQEEGLDEFVLKPLYTRQEIAEFRRKNERNGAFTVTEDTVRSTEDLEKLFFVWQDAVEIADDAKKIEIGEELEAIYSVRHLPSDFKKRNGYQRSVELSKEYGLYRQDYCGCVFSREERACQTNRGKP